MTRYYLLFIFVLASVRLFSQEADTVSGNAKITVNGTVINETGESSFSSLFVVNHRTRTGNFAESNGTFKVTIKKTDTLIIGALNYRTKTISFVDSAYKPEYNIKVVLMPLEIDLPQVDIFAPRTLKEIYEEIEDLGYDEKEYKVSGVNALQSPITALYAAFSRKEQQKREAYRLINEARKRDLLKELFQKYVHYDIINLNDDEFDDFIDYCNVNEEFMKSATQYEFIMYIKYKYKYYRKMTKYDDYYRD